MPSHDVGDACYRGIVGITYCRTKHPLILWKVSERPLIIYPYKRTPDFATLGLQNDQHLPESSEKPLYKR